MWEIREIKLDDVVAVNLSKEFKKENDFGRLGYWFVRFGYITLKFL